MAARVNPFPYPVSSLADLPEHYQQAVRRTLSPDESINSILIIPAQPFLKRGGTSQQALLSTSRGLLHLQEMPLPDQPPITTYLPGDALLYAYHSLLLLYGRLELAGEVDDNLVHLVIEYNTVGEDFLEAVLKQFLRFTYKWSDTEKSYHPQSESLLDSLRAQSFKFMNGLQLYALQPGEKLLGVVYQPRITLPVLHFFRRPIAPEALLALTDKAVILIAEDKAWGAAYGWIITLCPRTYVAGVEIRPNKEWSDVCVCLARNKLTSELRVTFQNDLTLVWENLWHGQNDE